MNRMDCESTGTRQVMSPLYTTDGFREGRALRVSDKIRASRRSALPKIVIRLHWKSTRMFCRADGSESVLLQAAHTVWFQEAQTAPQRPHYIRASRRSSLPETIGPHLSGKG
jgi:hypothetical protein